MSETIYCFKPIVDKKSKLLILGTMPGVVSLKKKEYYGHPQNTFWKVLADSLDEPMPADYRAKLAMIKKHRIALWDVFASCLREGASDQAIREAEVNDIPAFLKKYPGIKALLFDGQKAEQTFKRYYEGKIALPGSYVPSTSPAHTMPYALKRKFWKDAVRRALAL